MGFYALVLHKRHVLAQPRNIGPGASPAMKKSTIEWAVDFKNSRGWLMGCKYCIRNRLIQEPFLQPWRGYMQI